GASYTREYFDVPVPGYSMADHFTGRGFTLVALDHLGSGESSWPAAASPDLVAAANDRAVAVILATARQEVIPGGATVIGIGHSMGGQLVTRQQADHRTFAAIAVLGWSATHTIIRAADGSLLTSVPDSEREPAIADAEVVTPERFRDLPPGYLYTRPRSALARWAFYPDDLDPAVIAADEAAIGVVAPGVYAADGFSSPGFGLDSARRVDVPVLLAFGDRDTTPDAAAEPSFYPAAPEITLVRLPGSSHCHNFAPSRVRLWDRLLAWGSSLT
ncbi:MAG TPA: alpha/beta fold hydrolase, partial [Solirubrobacterales bacterium]|nr:alpha/beta fold hydrolase [Solirubrobacterales bacterium]